MGTTAEKLTFLNTTKEKLKDTINITGANIDNDDTFRNYNNKLESSLVNIINNGTSVLYDNFPKSIQSGDDLHFTDVYSSKMTVDISGELEKVNSDILVSTGSQKIIAHTKNLVDLYKHTNTLASNTSILSSNSYECNNTGTWQGRIILRFNNLKKNTTYTFYFTSSPSSSRSILSKINGVKNGNATALVSSIYKSYLPVSFNTSDYEYITIDMYARGNGGETGVVTVSNIQLEEGSKKTTFEEYQEIQEYPLSLDSLELCEINNAKDSFFKNTIDSPLYDDNLVENEWYLNKKIAKISSYNGEVITTDYVSSTGSLDEGALVYYVNTEEQNILIDDENYATLHEQLNNIDLHSYIYDTYIYCKNTDDTKPLFLTIKGLKKGE